MSAPRFFRTPAAFRAWLDANHDHAAELVVGFYKKSSGKPSITWPESVDEALCYGWIDGVRRPLGDESYTIRFSPRKSTSIWSNVNIAKVRALLDVGRMMPAGIAALEEAGPRRDTGGLRGVRPTCRRCDACDSARVARAPCHIRVAIMA